MSGKTKAKTQTIKGATVYTPVKYFSSTGKVPVAFFTISDGREIYSLTCFRDFATRASKDVKENDRGTFEIRPKEGGEGYICEFFLLDKMRDVATVQAKRHTTPKDREIAKKHLLALASRGMAKITINVNGAPTTVIRKREGCVELEDGTLTPKIEFVMDRLGADVVTKRLRDALGRNVAINKTASEKYKALLAEMFAEALLQQSKAA